MSDSPTEAEASGEGVSADAGSGDDVAEWVERAADGDSRAARKLFERFQDSVMGYCMLSADGDRDAAKDLTQEVFIKVFRRLDQLEDPSSFNSWMWTIARRICASHGSRRGRYGEILDLYELDRDVVLAHEDKTSRERRISCVHDVLEEVDDGKMSKIAELKYTEPEHTTREIASKLDMPHGTVTVKLMRFRERIADRLAAELDQIDDSRILGGRP